MYEIKKNVPVPEKQHGGGRPQKYPFAEMDVGDMFFVPCAPKDYTKTRSAVSSSARLRVRRSLQDRQFTIRKQEGGVSVWRIK